MRFKILLFPVLAICCLSACKPAQPAAEPSHPLLAGQWRGTFSKKGCAAETVRFVNDRIVMRREGRELPIFVIRNLSASGSSIDMDLEISDRAIFALGTTRTKAEELSQRGIFVTLSVGADTITLRDAQMSDPKRGRYIPQKGERNQLNKLFSFSKCPDIAS